MTEHLVLMSIGPVQAFIAEARRTRDLWFGSHVLSEIAKAAARAIVDATDNLECLVFPAPNSRSELEPWDEPIRREEMPLNVANKILAVVPAGRDPKVLATKARTKAKERWQGFANEVWAKWNGASALAKGATHEVWNAQIDGLLEFQAAWIPLGQYDAARKLLEAQLAGRKALRDFAPAAQGIRGAYKSSLDGGRDSVLRRNASDRKNQPISATKLFQRARIGTGEQLDAVGLVKRAGGEPDQFIPVSRVAVADWIDRAEALAPELLANVERMCKDRDMTRVNRNDVTWVANFHYDGHVFMPGRRDALVKESVNDDTSRVEQARPDWQPLFTDADKIIKKCGEPDPYVACLVADGDKMGDALSKLGDPEQHRKFSRHLASFAQQARKIVEQDNRGMLVYAGGDDVLAFVNVADAVKCAKELADAFLACMGQALPGVEANKLPTLSVGVGIGHCMESMGHLLELGRTAEKLAKGSSLPDNLKHLRRNALAILLDKRSGGRIQWRAQWSTEPVQRLENDQELIRGEKLSTKKIYEVRACQQRMPKPASVAEADKATVAMLLRREVARIISRSGVGEGDEDSEPDVARRTRSRKLNPVDVALDVSADLDYAMLYRRIEDWTARLLIAKSLVRRQPVLEPAGQGV